MSGRMYGLDEGAVARMAPWLAFLLKQGLVPAACVDDAQDIVDENAAVKAAAVRRAARLHRDANSDANSGRCSMQTVSPSGVSASVGSLARQAGVTSAAVTHFLRQVERSGRRLPRVGRRWGPIPADVATDFMSQSRKAAR